MSNPSLVTEEVISAGAVSVHELVCWELLAGEPCPHEPDRGDYSHVVAHAALTAAAPAIAAKALQEAVDEMRRVRRGSWNLPDHDHPDEAAQSVDVWLELRAQRIKEGRG